MADQSERGQSACVVDGHEPCPVCQQRPGVEHATWCMRVANDLAVRSQTTEDPGVNRYAVGFDEDTGKWLYASDPVTDDTHRQTPCSSCIGQAVAAVDRAAVPLQHAQPGGFWDGFKYAQKALADLLLASSGTCSCPACYGCTSRQPERLVTDNASQDLS